MTAKAAQVKKVIKQAPRFVAKKLNEYEPNFDDDEEILSDDMDVDDCMELSEVESEEVETCELEEASRFAKGYNKYGTEDPILAAAEEALDNGLFDSEGNIDEDGFEGLFGVKFDDGANQEEDDEEDEVEEEDEQDATEEVEVESSLETSEQSDTESELAEPVVAEVVKVESDEQVRLKKQIKGLLNRLSLGNFESIAGSIEALYREYPRREVTETILELVLTAITSQANLLDSFILVFAALIGALSHMVGVEFAAFLLQRIVEIYDEKNSKGNSLSDEAKRTVMNLISFLSFIYDLQIVSYKIIGDIIYEAVSRLDELDTEIVLKLVRNCGGQFRRDDPTTLKKIILTLTERLQSIKEQSSRFKFMVESIYDLKNNKQKSSQLQSGDLETVKKLLRNMAQQRGIAKFEPIRIGLDDVRNADVKGRWWLIGGTWAPEKATSEMNRTVLFICEMKSLTQFYCATSPQ